MATSKKNSVNAALGWQKRKVRKEAIAMPNDAVAMRSHKVAMPNHAEEKRREEKREEEKRKEEKREEDKWFNVFWDSFGKKQDLQKCQAKWSKLTEKEKNAALDKVAAYVHSTPDVQFRKNPLTWLNGKCWEDEIIIPTLNTKISNFEKAVKADLHSMIIYDNDNE